MISNRRRGRTPTKFMVSWSVTVSTYNMVPTIFSLYMLLLCTFFLYCSSIDIMTSNSNFTIIDGETTLVSAGERFELGFFSSNASSGYDRYVGIWYYKKEPLTVVWIANRDKPLPDSYGTGSSFAITEDGNLKVLDEEGKVYWTTTDLEVSWSSLKTAKLHDSGNLIFCESSSGKILWESFKNSTDTFLPGMKMDEGLVLTSWKSLHDPAEGNYTFQMDGTREHEFIIQKGSRPYWRSGESSKIVSSDDHIPVAVASLLRGDSVTNSRNPTPYKNSTKSISYNNLTIPPGDNFTRLVMGFDGVLQYLIWDFNKAHWSLKWREPRDRCSVDNACGNFGSCKINNGCKCLPGFEPSSDDDWNFGEFSGGCERKSRNCEESDIFLSLNIMKVGNPDTQSPTRNMSEDDCGKACLSSCICKAYLFDEPKNSTKRDKGDTSSPKCWIWNEDLFNLQEEEEHVDGGRHLHLRVGSPDKVSEGGGSTNNSKGPSRKKMPLTLIIAVACIVFFLIALLCTIAYVFYTRKRRASTSQGHRNNIQSDRALHLFGSESRVKHLIDSGEFREDDKKGIDVPFFDLESILAATDNFSDTNKLGQGGFGPVYKGKFQGDQEIAVKRLSSLSGQGLQEFKNEVVLIAKLQHRNLVRLLGYCISGEERILLYEYMPNKSLDSFIFDRTLSVLLDWEVRFNIILGVARGLLYLHQDSRLRIIHRDLKTSNILLDEEMNPKISDFGLARIFAGKQTEAATERIIGTYGYMSPEYALDGFFSVKSDVFSFGVVVLEIISGKRTTGSYQSEQSLSLLGYAWRFWKEEKALELMDQTLLETCNTSEFLKCVNVGLLCVQEDPSDRPTMSNVVFMLGSETATLPSPKQPAFVARRELSITGSSSSKQEAWPYNELSITSEDGQ